MAAFQDTQTLRFAGADDLALISAVIRAETQAFQDDDISAWSEVHWPSLRNPTRVRQDTFGALRLRLISRINLRV